MLDPAIMSDATRLKELDTQIRTAEARVAQIYARWEELEALNRGS
jgi:ATP-binding cassette subfamily F protein uup